MPLVALAFADCALNNLETIPHKFRVQIIKKAKALIIFPRPKGYIQLKDKKSAAGEPIYRIRSGDYRILYVVRTNPNEVVILDIDDRKDVYK